MERRYRIIEPLLSPGHFTSIWAKNRGKRVKVIDWLGRCHKVSRRTIYHLLAIWDRDGYAGLAPRSRCDRGISRILTPAALEFLQQAATEGKTARALYRSYIATQHTTEALPAMSYGTFRKWLGWARRSHAARAMVLVMPGQMEIL